LWPRRDGPGDELADAVAIHVEGHVQVAAQHHQVLDAPEKAPHLGLLVGVVAPGAAATVAAARAACTSSRRVNRDMLASRGRGRTAARESGTGRPAAS